MIAFDEALATGLPVVALEPKEEIAAREASPLPSYEALAAQEGTDGALVEALMQQVGDEMRGAAATAGRRS